MTPKNYSDPAVWGEFLAAHNGPPSIAAPSPSVYQSYVERAELPDFLLAWAWSQAPEAARGSALVADIIQRVGLDLVGRPYVFCHEDLDDSEPPQKQVP